MPVLEARLAKALEGAEKIVFLGVGSEFCGDDAAGILAARALRKKTGRRSGGVPAAVLVGGAAPENLTGVIKKIRPSHLVILDAVDSGKKPGSVRLVPPGRIGGVSFSTHKLPLKEMADYLGRSMPLRALLVGIEARSGEFGAPVSAPVRAAVSRVVTALEAVIR